MKFLTGIFSVTIFLSASTSVVFAQKSNSNNPSASVQVIANPAIDSLVSKHVKINSEAKGFPGFRVQIFSDSGTGARERANEKRSAFVSKYPEVAAYLDFNNPNFIVRVGDFRTKLEARKFLNDVAVDFPYAFVRKDMIQPPPIE